VPDRRVTGPEQSSFFSTRPERDIMTNQSVSSEARHEETRHTFEEVMDQIRQGLVRMGSLVVENVERAGTAMRERRLELIPIVMEGDEEINRLYAHYEATVFETLARQAPVAGDLRFLVAATRMLYELERSGDLAVNCVKMLDREDGFPNSPRLLATLDEMVHASTKVFAMGVEAIADMSPDAGARLDAADDEVDDLVSRFYTEIGQESDAIGLNSAIALSRVGRFLERIADHAVNIGEHVTFIVTAEFADDTHASVRHES
jgi:phosphate transport system protein